MARVNIYLPDELADAARAEGLNVSAVSREAIESRLAVARNNAWLDDLARRRRGRPTVRHEDVIAALDAAKAELGDEWPTTDA